MSFANLRDVGAKKHLQKLIPVGDYCYTYTGRVMIGNRVVNHDGELMKTGEYYWIPETKSCPFWSKSSDEDAHCSFLEHTSKYAVGSDKGFDLLWDQIKECGVNPHPDEEYYLNEGYNDPTRPDLEPTTKRAKTTPQFISSIVRIIMSSPDDHFKYDGTTYVLSQSVIDDLSK